MKIKPPCSCLIVHVDAFTDRIEKRDPDCPAHGDARLAELDQPEVHQAVADKMLDVLDIGAAAFSISPDMDDVSLVERVARATRDEEDGSRLADSDHDGLG